jgi:hypothetical protein
MTSHPSDRPVSALRTRMIEDMTVPAPPTAGSFPGGFRTPTPRHAWIGHDGPASETLHRKSHSRRDGLMAERVGLSRSAEIGYLSQPGGHPSFRAPSTPALRILSTRYCGIAVLPMSSLKPKTGASPSTAAGSTIPNRTNPHRPSRAETISRAFPGDGLLIRINPRILLLHRAHPSARGRKD